MMSYHHWNEDEVEEPWNLYSVSAYVPEYGAIVIEPWPVYAAGYEQAMDVFQILLQLSVDK
jgi:hypothetical protein